LSLETSFRVHRTCGSLALGGGGEQGEDLGPTLVVAAAAGGGGDLGKVAAFREPVKLNERVGTER
jgi:hypothetical protein